MYEAQNPTAPLAIDKKRRLAVDKALATVSPNLKHYFHTLPEIEQDKILRNAVTEWRKNLNTFVNGGASFLTLKELKNGLESFGNSVVLLSTLTASGCALGATRSLVFGLLGFLESGGISLPAAIAAGCVGGGAIGAAEWMTYSATQASDKISELAVDLGDSIFQAAIAKNLGQQIALHKSGRILAEAATLAVGTLAIKKTFNKGAAFADPPVKNGYGGAGLLGTAEGPQVLRPSSLPLRPNSIFTQSVGRHPAASNLGFPSKPRGVVALLDPQSGVARANAAERFKIIGIQIGPTISGAPAPYIGTPGLKSQLPKIQLPPWFLIDPNDHRFYQATQEQLKMPPPKLTEERKTLASSANGQTDKAAARSPTEQLVKTFEEKAKSLTSGRDTFQMLVASIGTIARNLRDSTCTPEEALRVFRAINQIRATIYEASSKENKQLDSDKPSQSSKFLVLTARAMILRLSESSNNLSAPELVQAFSDLAVRGMNNLYVLPKLLKRIAAVQDDISGDARLVVKAAKALTNLRIADKSLLALTNNTVKNLRITTSTELETFADSLKYLVLATGPEAAQLKNSISVQQVEDAARLICSLSTGLPTSSSPDRSQVLSWAWRILDALTDIEPKYTDIFLEIVNESLIKSFKDLDNYFLTLTYYRLLVGLNRKIPEDFQEYVDRAINKHRTTPRGYNKDRVDKKVLNTGLLDRIFEDWDVEIPFEGLTVDIGGLVKLRRGGVEQSYEVALELSDDAFHSVKRLSPTGGLEVAWRVPLDQRRDDFLKKRGIAVVHLRPFLLKEEIESTNNDTENYIRLQIENAVKELGQVHGH